MRRHLGKIASLLWRKRNDLHRPIALLGLDIPLDAASPDSKASADIARLLAGMPPAVLETYLLRTVDGMAIDEIADYLAMSRWRVRRNLRRAIAFLLL
ncbi:sigma factor-like helix-turn-helix DNA-binding protein [Sphingomonas oryzagri]